MAFQKEIWKHIKKADVKGATASELIVLFPQSEEELTATLKRLYAQTKIIRTMELRDGDKIIIDIKKMLAYQMDFLQRNPILVKDNRKESEE